jgi:hypothetical protein
VRRKGEIKRGEIEFGRGGIEKKEEERRDDRMGVREF